jgi:hypothetical protein
MDVGSFNKKFSFEKMDEIGKLEKNVRFILGIKEKDDWIYNLNIGNVMHLMPMDIQELNLHIDNSHELSRDGLLEKVFNDFNP